MLYMPLDLEDIGEVFRVKTIFNILFTDVTVTENVNDEVLKFLIDNMMKLKS